MDRLTIGELANRSRVNLETIRYYEREKLLPAPPRLQSGYRSFPSESVKRIRFIKQAQELGFSLKEIKELLELQIDPSSTGGDVRKRAEAKIADIEAKIKTLSAMKKALTQLTSACNGEGLISECPILESLGSEKE